MDQQSTQNNKYFVACNNMNSFLLYFFLQLLPLFFFLSKSFQANLEVQQVNFALSQQAAGVFFSIAYCPYAQLARWPPLLRTCPFHKWVGFSHLSTDFCGDTFSGIKVTKEVSRKKQIFLRKTEKSS